MHSAERKISLTSMLLSRHTILQKPTNKTHKKTDEIVYAEDEIKYVNHGNNKTTEIPI